MFWTIEMVLNWFELMAIIRFDSFDFRVGGRNNLRRQRKKLIWYLSETIQFQLNFNWPMWWQTQLYWIQNYKMFHWTKHCPMSNIPCWLIHCFRFVCENNLIVLITNSNLIFMTVIQFSAHENVHLQLCDRE